MIDKIKIIAEANFDYYSNIRHQIHRNPELSFQENETYAFICKELQEIGLEIENFSDKSVISVINLPNNKGKTIALRADIDALAIEEENNFWYKSKNPNVMHACGHDFHISSLLATAKILFELKDYLSVNIVFIFQHAEETLPGGAIELIKNGLFEKYKIDLIIGQHIEPQMLTGTFGFKSGEYMSSTDEIYINFTGTGGHAAVKNERSDTVLAAANFLVEIQQEVEKIDKNNEKSLLSFGKVIANGAVNIVPPICKTFGTLRCYDEKLRKQFKAQIKETANKYAKKYKCEAEIDIRDGYPHVFNDIELTQKASIISKEIFNKKSIFELEKQFTGEDFGYYSHIVPAVFFRTGVNNGEYENNTLHSPFLKIDDKALLFSSILFSYLVFNITQ